MRESGRMYGGLVGLCQAPDTVFAVPEPFCKSLKKRSHSELLWKTDQSADQFLPICHHSNIHSSFEL
jgi:hypothetical protein